MSNDDREEWLRQNDVYEVFELRKQLHEAQQAPKVWTLAQMFLPNAPFEYDQGDIVLAYWDELYDLNRRAETAEAQCATQAAQLQAYEKFVRKSPLPFNDIDIQELLIALGAGEKTDEL